MKGLFKFLDRHLGYLLIIPALIFILLFSVLPIAESLKFSFFDFQLNSQQKNGLYFNERYNTALMTETFDYMQYYLEIEAETVEKEETKAALAALTDRVSSAYDNYTGLVPEADEEGLATLSESVSNEIRSENKALQEEIVAFYERDDVFYAKEDLPAVASELDTAMIQPNFIGLDNFKKVFKDPRVSYAFGITIIFTAISVAFELCLGLVLALVMNHNMKGKGLVRTFSLIPWAIPTSVAALIWAYMYNGSSGIVAHMAAAIGLIEGPAELLLSGTNAIGGIILADVWKTTPYMALLLLAGLQTIPDSLYEASSLDGCSKWQQFMHVTLPLLKPSILVALLFRTLDAFRVFDLIWVLTGGGPGGKTESISIYAYKTMFAQTRFGYGSAVVIIMALAVGIVSYAYIKFLDVQLISED